MKKRKKIIKAGSLVLSCIYTPPAPRDQEHVRAAKSRMTTAARRAMNLRTARVKLELLLAANFSRKDLHVTLTYRDADLPQKRAGALKCIRKFIKQLRAYRKARDIPFKYIYVTEGQHGDKRLHHHIVLNAAGGDFDLIRSLWVYGHIDAEYIADREYDSLAEYITKESVENKPNGVRMWTGSQNLDKPVTEYGWVGEDETITPPAGCFVLEREEKQNEFGSFAYLKYRIAPITPRKTRPPRRK